MPSPPSWWRSSPANRSSAKNPQLSATWPSSASSELLDNGNSLRGNEYVIEGQIEEKLQWTTDRGQLVSVRVDTGSDDEFVGIEIPQEFNKLNIDTKQKYAFRVKFRQGGIPVATGVNRL